ncbi:MAG: 23S rRNA (guanosine(2251)-2'-O)-methyltransferase RlmB [Spirochaetaceae bacterium]|jgi:23S rRNA (guanosine2251-2'-O)-methyltransferase|nr:23S rRNA (guanosine(2251)-2'-O)-methyltransferase RlmB [Spirochaetaceae bacterium]
MADIKGSVVTGFHGVEELLKQSSPGVLYLCKKGTRIEELIKLCKAQGGTLKRISPKEMDKMSRDHRGFCFLSTQETAETGKAISDIQEFLSKVSHRKNPLVLILDSITDPHNLGAILRSSDLFSVDLVVIPKRRSASENDTVARTSAGAVQWVPLLTTANLSRAMDQLKEAGYWIYGAHMKGEPAASLDLKGPTVLVMGSEGKGISRLLQDKCDSLVSIPMTGHVDSLNVSVATGILLYEARRQQS